jgi:hypothetical protein
MTTQVEQRRRWFLKFPVVLIAIAATCAALGGVIAGAVSGEDGVALTACKDLPDSWQSASDFGLSADRANVILTWASDDKQPESRTATVAVTDTDCQEGLAAKTRELLDFQSTVSKESCKELEQLADAVRRANPGARGWADVPFEVDQALNANKDVSEKYGPDAPKHRIDLDYVDKVLATDCVEVASRP